MTSHHANQSKNAKTDLRTPCAKLESFWKHSRNIPPRHHLACPSFDTQHSDVLPLILQVVPPAWDRSSPHMRVCTSQSNHHHLIACPLCASIPLQKLPTQPCFRSQPITIEGGTGVNWRTCSGGDHPTAHSLNGVSQGAAPKQMHDYLTSRGALGVHTEHCEL
jgi:hypothetical protein